MKILHILNSSNIGGIEWFVYYLTKTQTTNNNLKVGILFCSEKGELKAKFAELPIKIHHINLGAFNFNFKKYSQLIAIAKSYDLVHMHSFKPMREWALYLTKNKLIYTNHTVFGYGRKTKLTDHLKRILFIHFQNRPTNFLTYNSNYTRTYWKNRGVTNTNSKIVYNGVLFKKVTTGLTKKDHGLSGKFIVGTSSRLINWKRVNLLIDAFYIFQKGKEDVHLLIVGDGLQRITLEALVRKYNIEHKVTFSGYQVNVEDYQYLMDVCVFPSTTEAFGLVAIECMYLGKPVLVMQDGGGIVEILNQIEPENIRTDNTSLANGIEMYYNNKSLLTGKFAQKRSLFATKFKMEVAEQEFYSIYQKINACQ